MDPQTRRLVSFDHEPLIVVDAEDRVLGYHPKAEVHQGAGILHRAFSVFLFNGEGELLLQQRSASKPLWPLYWSNSCCSHPRRGERDLDAAQRRTQEELGVAVELEFALKLQYHAAFEDKGSESELCSVFLGTIDGPCTPNSTEVADWQWISDRALDHALSTRPAIYTPWLHLEWAELRHAYAGLLARYTSP